MTQSIEKSLLIDPLTTDQQEQVYSNVQVTTQVKYLDVIEVFANNFSLLGVNQFIYQEWKQHATNLLPFSHLSIYASIPW